MDLVQNNRGPFDPMPTAVTKAKALAVRQAFLHAVPRQEVVDKLIKPINPDAEVRNAYLRSPGTTGYDEIVAQNGPRSTPRPTRPCRRSCCSRPASPGPDQRADALCQGQLRRESEYQLYNAASSKAGFKLVDKATPTGATDWVRVTTTRSTTRGRTHPRGER